MEEGVQHSAGQMFERAQGKFHAGDKSRVE